MKDFKIEIIKGEHWLNPKFPPHLKTVSNDGEELKQYNKPSLGQINIAIKKIQVHEYVKRTPLEEESSSLGQEECITGKGNMTGVRKNLNKPGSLVEKGDTIRMFGGEPHKIIGVSIHSKNWDHHEETKKKLGINIEDDYDVFSLQGWEEFGDGWDYEPEGFHVKILLKPKKYKKLLKRINSGEIKTLGITLEDLHKIPGLYKELDEYHLNSPWNDPQSFFFLPEKKLISNLNDDDFNDMPEDFYIHKFNIAFDGDSHGYANFYLTLNPHWLLEEMFE